MEDSSWINRIDITHPLPLPLYRQSPWPKLTLRYSTPRIMIIYTHRHEIPEKKMYLLFSEVFVICQEKYISTPEWRLLCVSYRGCWKKVGWCFFWKMFSFFWNKDDEKLEIQLPQEYFLHPTRKKKKKRSIFTGKIFVDCPRITIWSSKKGSQCREEKKWWWYYSPEKKEIIMKY